MQLVARCGTGSFALAIRTFSELKMRRSGKRFYLYQQSSQSRKTNELTKVVDLITTEFVKGL